MARCYTNENFPFPAVEALRLLGHDVLTTAESGRAGQAIPDTDILAFAVAENRIVVTLNRRHFIRLHHTTPMLLALWFVRLILTLPPWHNVSTRP
jgi:hypothetical protein